ncbi:MAG: 50S ribosomal protein L4 [Bacilli bacterium]|jgi:large subunit ribosomal protein L4|nr:50S ribosomal protein L4 [Bacilli bacterium]
MADMKLNVYNLTGEKVSTVNVSKDVFACEVNEQVMFDAVQVYMANSRQATAKTKNRSEVSGGGKKPFRQKGTGRARAGSTRSPIWVGGGNVFGPKGTQNYKISQNKKEHSLALRSALSQLGAKNIYVLDELKVEGKTKEVVALLKALKLEDKKVLLVSDDDLVLQAANNVSNLVLRGNGNVSVYDLLNVEALLLNKESVKQLEGGLK